jgi:hypothetical protein
MHFSRRWTTAEQERRSSGKHLTTKDNININKVSWREVPMRCSNGTRKKHFPTFYCELRGLNIAGKKATASKKSVNGKQKVRMDEGDEGNVENWYEYHAQAVTNEGLLELEKERFQERYKQHLSALATGTVTDGKATGTNFWPCLTVLAICEEEVSWWHV